MPQPESKVLKVNEFWQTLKVLKTLRVSWPKISGIPWPGNALAVAAVLIGFGLRLYKLGGQSLWYDETVSAFLAGQSPVALIAHTARDIHPPAYYLLLHFWSLVAGKTEFALAYLSLIFGVLLIPLTYQLACYLVNQRVATWAAWLTAFSPYHIWYSQEVRMYTLAAALGVAAAGWAWRALHDGPASGGLTKPARIRFWAGYLICAAIGLYTLYYFAFLLIVLNLFFLAGTLLPKIKPRALGSLLLVNSLLVAAYLPWLPIAWRQATNPPVPPWRTGQSLWSIILESWSALSLGQSVEPVTVWPVLLLTLALCGLGLYQLGRAGLARLSRPTPAGPVHFLFLPAYTFGSLLLIYLFSFLTPLYHVRYVFTYSPAFYILLGAGLVCLTSYSRCWLTPVAVTILLMASLFSIYRLHFNPRYQADDYRAAVNFIESHWQPGDAILVNAGYTYTAFVYYSNFTGLKRQRLVPYQAAVDLNQPLLLQTGVVDGPAQLGWADPDSDFYAMSQAETVTALEAVSADYARLWLLRAYDTVTDPTGLIRTWLAAHAIPLEDEVFAGESNIRAQGFLLARPTEPIHEIVEFEDGMALAGWELPERIWQPGQTIYLKLWWLATASPGIDYKMSLKLWTPTGQLAAQGQDQWPVGTLFRATAWPIGRPIYHPVDLTLPVDLPAGQYWLNVELYHPETILPLHRPDGSAAVTLGSIRVEARE